MVLAFYFEVSSRMWHCVFKRTSLPPVIRACQRTGRRSRSAQVPCHVQKAETETYPSPFLSAALLQPDRKYAVARRADSSPDTLAARGIRNTWPWLQPPAPGSPMITSCMRSWASKFRLIPCPGRSLYQTSSLQVRMRSAGGFAAVHLDEVVGAFVLNNQAEVVLVLIETKPLNLLISDENRASSAPRVRHLHVGLGLSESESDGFRAFPENSGRMSER